MVLLSCRCRHSLFDDDPPPSNISFSMAICWSGRCRPDFPCLGWSDNLLVKKNGSKRGQVSDGKRTVPVFYLMRQNPFIGYLRSHYPILSKLSPA